MKHALCALCIGLGVVVVILTSIPATAQDSWSPRIGAMEDKYFNKKLRDLTVP